MQFFRYLSIIFYEFFLKHEKKLKFLRQKVEFLSIFLRKMSYLTMAEKIVKAVTVCK